MRRVTAGLMAAGFVFVFFSIPVAGVDILIDAVGFLLVFNGLRPLAKLHPHFRFSPAVSLFLVVVTAAQLFLPASLARTATIMRAAGETSLYILIANGYGRSFLAGGKPGQAAFSGGIFTLCAVATAAFVVSFLSGTFTAATNTILVICHILVLCVLLWLCLLPKNRERPTEL